jgi:hypothetical protein
LRKIKNRIIHRTADTINQHLIKLKKRFLYKLEFYGIKSPSEIIERLIKNEKKVINPFITRHKYACPDCKSRIRGKNFHRHADEFKYSKFEKDFCLFYRRDCVKQVVDY